MADVTAPCIYIKVTTAKNRKPAAQHPEEAAASSQPVCQSLVSDGKARGSGFLTVWTCRAGKQHPQPKCRIRSAKCDREKSAGAFRSRNTKSMICATVPPRQQSVYADFHKNRKEENSTNMVSQSNIFVVKQG